MVYSIGIAENKMYWIRQGEIPSYFKYTSQSHVAMRPASSDACQVDAKRVS
jgi:hypothetical protein